jgi:hypothetical protein
MVVCSLDVLSDKLNTLAGPLAPTVQHALQPLGHHRSGLSIQSVKPNDWAASVPTQLRAFVAYGDADSLINHARGQSLFHAFPR